MADQDQQLGLELAGQDHEAGMQMRDQEQQRGITEMQLAAKAALPAAKAKEERL